MKTLAKFPGGARMVLSSDPVAAKDFAALVVQFGEPVLEQAPEQVADPLAPVWEIIGAILSQFENHGWDQKRLLQELAVIRDVIPQSRSEEILDALYARRYGPRK